MTFEQWWKKHRPNRRADSAHEKTLAFRAWKFAIAAERRRCARIARSLGGDIDMNNPDESKLCANSIEWDILGRPGVVRETPAKKTARKSLKAVGVVNAGRALLPNRKAPQ